MNFINRLLVNFSYSLETSDGYQKRRRFFSNLLENDKYKYKKYFDYFMMILIFVSVSILIYDVKEDVHATLAFFNAYIISFIFFIEYILRLWVHSSISKVIIHQSEYSDLLGRDFDLWYVVKRITKDKVEYIISPKALIDLFAIMPFFHELRLLRVFILFRVFKIFRYAKSLEIFTDVLATKKFEFLTLAMFAGIVVFVSSVLIYVMEANNPNSSINTLFGALYWSIVTISTVGYGDVVPVTKEGQFVAIIVILSGIAVIAFTTSLFVSAFTEKIEDIKEGKTIQDVSKFKRIYIICGYENIAIEVARKLKKTDMHILVLDDSLERTEKAKKDGLYALNYSPGSVASYKNIDINLETDVVAILCLREDDVANVYTALTIRSLDKNVKIMSLLMNRVNKNKLLYSGVNEILYEKEFVGLIAREYVGSPVAFEAIQALRAEENNIKIEEILITERIAQSAVTVGDLENIRFRVVLLGIQKKAKKRFYFNPIDSTLLEAGDFLVVIGNYMFIREFFKFLAKKEKAEV